MGRPLTSSDSLQARLGGSAVEAIRSESSIAMLGYDTVPGGLMKAQASTHFAVISAEGVTKAYAPASS
jgi:hypothetical protein